MCVLGREEESQGDPTYVHLEYTCNTCTCTLHKKISLNYYVC